MLLKSANLNLLRLLKVKVSARTKLPLRPDGVLNGHGDLKVSKMAYFGYHLVPRSKLGRHQVAPRHFWSPFGSGTCVHL